MKQQAIFLNKNKKKHPLLITFALIVLVLCFGGATAIIASGTDNILNSFIIGLQGSMGEGSSYSARSHLSANTGTKSAQGSSYVANIGFFGSSQAASYDPVIVGSAVIPRIIINGSQVALFIQAVYATNTSANITIPNGSLNEIVLANAMNTSFSNTSLIGRYNVTFIAKNLQNITVVSQDYFEAVIGLGFTILLSDNNGSPIDGSLIAFYNSTVMDINSTANGNVTLFVPDLLYDLMLNASNNSASFFVQQANISENTGKAVTVDRYDSGDFLSKYGINSSLAGTNHTIRLHYGSLSYINKENIKLYKCSAYDIPSRNCTGSWDDTTDTALNNQEFNYLEFSAAGGGFGLKEIIPPAPQTTIPPSSSSGGDGFGLRSMKASIEKNCSLKEARFSLADSYNSDPISNVIVTLKDSSGILIISKTSDNFGKAIFTLDDGLYHASLSKAGYSYQNEFFSMDCNEPINSQTVEPKANHTLNKSTQAGEKAESITGLAADETIIQTSTETKVMPDEQMPAEIAPEEETINHQDLNDSLIKTQQWLFLIIALVTLSIITIAVMISRLNAKQKADEKPDELQTSIREKKTEDDAKGHSEAHTVKIEPAMQVQPPIHANMQESTSTVDNIKSQNNSGNEITQPDEKHHLTENKQVAISEISKTKIHTETETDDIISRKNQFIDVPYEQQFVLADGSRIRNIQELAQALINMHPDVFSSHVTPQKNDFAAWIYHVIGDKELAEEIGHIKYRQQILDCVKEKIDSIKE